MSQDFIYYLLGAFFLSFFALWFILHIKDRRRVFNGLAFFISIGSLFALMMMVGFLKDWQFLVIIPSLTFLGLLVLIPLLYLLGIIILFTTGRTVIKREGLSLSHILGILLGLGIIGSSIILPIFLRRIKSRVIIGVMGFFVSIFSYFVLGFIIFLTSSLIYYLYYERRNKDYIIVLGAGLSGNRVTPLLAGRINRAIDFYQEQKTKGKNPPKLIMSGGQGPDEIVPEALAMKNHALEMGIPEEDILMEDKSRNTEENLKFSSKIIEEDGGDPKKSRVLFSTSNYHVLRAGILARSLGYNYQGMGSKTRLYYYVPAIIREYIGVIYLNLNKNLIFALLLGLFYLLNYILN